MEVGRCGGAGGVGGAFPADQFGDMEVQCVNREARGHGKSGSRQLQRVLDHAG